jgi:SCP-2 sterol transfer family
MGMASPTEQFFDELGRRGNEPLLAKVTGTVRFDIVQGLYTENWYVRVDKGDVRVSREAVEADAVVRMGRELFDRAAAGEMSVFPRLMRGEVLVEGDASLVVLLERLFPGQRGPRDRPPSIRSRPATS